MNDTQTIEAPAPTIAAGSPAPLPAVVRERAVNEFEGDFDVYFDTRKFEQAYRVARLFSDSTIIPAHFQGNPSNCFIALQASTRLQVDPFMFMQRAYVAAAGKIGLEATLVIALVNQRGPFADALAWRAEGSGDSRSWTCFGRLRKSGELCEMTIRWQDVVAEGWNKRNGSKWNTIPELMGRYRSAAWLARLYCPGVILGLPTIDELDDADLIDAKVATERAPIQMPRELPAEPRNYDPPEVHAAPAITPTLPVSATDVAPAETPRATPAPSPAGPVTPPAAAPLAPTPPVWPGPAGSPLTTPMMKQLFKSMEKNGKTDEQFHAKFGYLPKQTTFDTINAALNWIEGTPL